MCIYTSRWKTSCSRVTINDLLSQEILVLSETFWIITWATSSKKISSIPASPYSHETPMLIPIPHHGSLPNLMLPTSQLRTPMISWCPPTRKDQQRGGKARGRMNQRSGTGPLEPHRPGSEPHGGSARSVALGTLLSDHKPQFSRLYNGKDNCFSLTGFWQRLSELANTAFRKNSGT